MLGDFFFSSLPIADKPSSYSFSRQFGLGNTRSQQSLLVYDVTMNKLQMCRCGQGGCAFSSVTNYKCAGVVKVAVR